MYNESNRFINKASANLAEYQKSLESNVHFSFRMKNKGLERLNEKLTYRAKNQLDDQLRKLNYFEKAISHLDPQNVLKKGYSITKHKGKPVTSATKLKQGDEIETILFEGEVVSKVK